MKKIDIHCHTTKRKIEDTLPASADIEAISSEMKTHNIEKTVLLATYFPHRGSGISNFRLLDWTAGRCEFLLFGSLDFKHYFHQGISELAELAERKLISGIKVYTGYQKIDLHSKNFLQLILLAQKNGLPMMFHCGNSYSAMRIYGTPAIEGLVLASEVAFVARDNCVPIIVSHLAKPRLGDLIKTVNSQKNIYADMSGLFDSKYGREYIPRAVLDVKQFLHECGPKKLLFGTDFPVQTHEDSVYVVEEAMKDFSRDDKADVYCNNASHILCGGGNHGTK